MENELKNLMVKMYAGSIAYGTSLPTSDVDFRGIFCADPINVRTPFFPIREKVDLTEEDTKYYELSNFMKLCLDCNPNIIELLWTDESHIVHTSEAYNHLRSFREDFLSSKLAFTFSGYAMAQLKRIKGHNKWINNPQPVAKPAQSDYLSLLHNFTEEKLFKFDAERFLENHKLVPYGNHVYGVYLLMDAELYNSETGVLHKDYEGSKDTLGYPKFIVKFNEPEYTTAKIQHNQYWEWKQNRNVDRSALEQQFGYDTKHSMHLVRLLRMGKEALSGQGIIVHRPDAKELLEIREGKWKYEEILKYAEGLDQEIQELYKNTSLRKKPDIKLAAKVLMDIQDIVWKE